MTIHGPQTRTAVSNANGWWQVGSLPLGEYNITIQAPAGYMVTSVETYHVTLTSPCQRILSLYFGLAVPPTPTPTPTWTPTSTPSSTPTWTPTPTPSPTPTPVLSSIEGRVCHDLNSDGTCQDTEPGIQDIIVILDPSAGRTSYQLTTRSTTTDETGAYRFDEVEPGQHTLHFEDPSHQWFPAPVEVLVETEQHQTVQVQVHVSTPARRAYFPWIVR